MADYITTYTKVHFTPLNPKKEDLRIEEHLLCVIYEHYLGNMLSEDEEAIVKNADDTLLYHEFLHYMGEELKKPPGKLQSTPIFMTLPFREVEEAYGNYF